MTAPPPSPGPRLGWVLAVLLAGASSFTGVFNHTLWTPDEPRVAAIGAEMLRRSDWTIPTLAGEPFVQKPPLYWWTMVVAYRALGVSDGAARIPSAVAAFATLLLTYAMTRRLSDPRAGLMATMALASLASWAIFTHRAMVDPLLAFCVTLGYWGFVRGFHRDDGEGYRPVPDGVGILAIYLGGALAFLTKGPVGVVLLGAPIGLTLLLRRPPRLGPSWLHLAGLGFLGLGAGLWPALLWHRGRLDLLKQFVVGSLIQRIDPDLMGHYEHGHSQELSYYVISAAPLMLPWLLALPAVYRAVHRRRLPAGWNHEGLMFLAWALPLAVVILSIPETKRGVYVLPVFPALCAVVGAWLASGWMGDPGGRLDHGCRFAILVSLVAACLVVLLGVTPLPPGTLSLSGRDRVQAFLAGSSPLLQAALVALAVLLLAVVAWGFLLWRRRSHRANVVLVAVPFVFWLGLNLFAYRLLEPGRNLHRLTDSVLEHRLLEPPAVAYLLDETGRGILSFDLDRLPHHLDSQAQLLQHARLHPGSLMLVPERRLGFVPQEVSQTLRLVERWEFTDHRVYDLYEIGSISPQPTP